MVNVEKYIDLQEGTHLILLRNTLILTKSFQKLTSSKCSSLICMFLLSLMDVLFSRQSAFLQVTTEILFSSSLFVRARQQSGFSRKTLRSWADPFISGFAIQMMTFHYLIQNLMIMLIASIPLSLKYRIPQTLLGVLHSFTNTQKLTLWIG